MNIFLDNITNIIFYLKLFGSNLKKLFDLVNYNTKRQLKNFNDDVYIIHSYIRIDFYSLLNGVFYDFAIALSKNNFINQHLGRFSKINLKTFIFFKVQFFYELFGNRNTK